MAQTSVREGERGEPEPGGPSPAPNASPNALRNGSIWDAFMLDISRMCARAMPLPVALVCTVVAYVGRWPLGAVAASAAHILCHYVLDRTIDERTARGQPVDWLVGPVRTAVTVAFTPLISWAVGPDGLGWLSTVPFLCVMGFLAKRHLWLHNALIAASGVLSCGWAGGSYADMARAGAALAALTMLSSPLVVQFRKLWERAIEAGEALEVANHELRERQAQLEVLLGEARQAVLAKDRFLANMSHEMRTPLNGILGVVSLLRSSELSDDQRDLLEMARQSAGDLLAQVTNVLDLTKLEADRMLIDSEPFDLLSEAQRLASEFRCMPSCAEKSFRFEVSGPVPRWVIGDRTRIRQVVRNLLGNAFKFTAQDGHVELRLEWAVTADPSRTRVRLWVIDDGIGIPVEAHERIFQRFEQVDSSTTRKYGGTGLGLAISRQLIEAMGGSIGVESEPGHGSRFWFELELPCASHDVIQTTAGEASLSGAAGVELGGRSILLVEDLRINQIVATRLLEKLGCRVELAGNGMEALEALSRTAFDAVLMDCQMPELDGFAATRQLRELERTGGKPRTPVVALTAGVTPGDEERCLAAGMDGFLSKPLHEGDLDRALARVLGGAQPSGEPSLRVKTGRPA